MQPASDMSVQAATAPWRRVCSIWSSCPTTTPKHGDIGTEAAGSKRCGAIDEACSGGAGNPANLNAFNAEPDRYEVDASHIEVPGKRPHLHRLGCIERVERVLAIDAPFSDPQRLHLDGDPRAVPLDDEVDLTSTDTNVAVDDRETAPNQVVGSDSLPKLAQPTRRQRRTPGSSSSIFTSRKVSTRTCCRNLAGRYISHTQASSSSISK